MDEERTYPVPEWALSPQQAQTLVLASLRQIQSNQDTMAAEVQRLRDEVAGESHDDATNARIISGLARTVRALLLRLDKADQLVAAAKAGEAGALAELETVLVGVRQAIETLQSDNP